MKKGSILFSLLIGFLSLGAQQTIFNITASEPSLGSSFSVWKGMQWLGNTDASGNLRVAKMLKPEGLRIMHDSVLLEHVLVRALYSDNVNEIRLMVYPRAIESVVIQAVKGTSQIAYASSNVSQQEIKVQNTGRDLPVLLQMLPSVTTTSDAGNGVGYTGIRVRGSDASRTNVTVNGVPINDAESQGTFWVNMPDLASSAGNIQVQRGLGSSTNGAGAFGATVNIETFSSPRAYGMLSNSAGSYGTIKNTIAAGTGLLNGHWSADMRLSRIQSNGYIDRASSNLSSYLLSAGYTSGKFSFKLLNFAGGEKTYQAWYGIPVEKLNGDKNAMLDQYNRNLGFIYRNAEDSSNFYNSNNRTYNYYTYKNEMDNYKQGHLHAYFNYNFNYASRLNLTLYRTHGEGYFEQWRPSDDITHYGKSPAIFGTDTIQYTDLIRQRWLNNNLTGINANYQLQTGRLQLIAGGGYSQYAGKHYGQIIWTRTAPGVNYQDHYYDATGDKNDANIFVKINEKVGRNLYVLADLQWRRVHHQGAGFDNDLRKINFNKTWNFFNPKFGINWHPAQNQTVYFSVASGHKEPARSDFTDNKPGAVPKPESMVDYEGGWKFVYNRIYLEGNLYYMDYVNQLVPTGAVNDVGTALRSNVARSHRAGLELIGSWMISNVFTVNGNLTLSQNLIRSFDAISFNYLTYTDSIRKFKKVPIAYSPSVIGSAGITWHIQKTLSIRWNHKYVGRQYLDNTGDKSKSIAGYYFSEIWMNKTWNLKQGLQLELQLQVLNLFNAKYNNNGYTYDYISGTAGNPQRIQEVYVFPSATRNYLGGLVLKF